MKLNNIPEIPLITLFISLSLSPSGVHSHSQISLSLLYMSPLFIDASEPTEKRIEHLITENPIIIFSRRSCCMCHIMKQLFMTIGAHPTVIELEEAKEEEAAAGARVGLPAVFIGGSPSASARALIALHLSGVLLPRLKEVVTL